MNDRSSRERVRVWIAVAAVAAVGWLLRALPALSSGSWWRAGMGYDDAIYYAGSALLWRGEMPYRDFLLAHPPGFLVLLAPIASLASELGPADAVPVARWLMTLVGVANIVLSGHLALRAAGPVAAVFAALAYAFRPEALVHERSTFLEPFLILTCLLGASAWLSTHDGRERNGPLVAGLWLGLACAVKMWGLIWVAACVLAPPTAAASREGKRAPFSGRLRDWARSWGWLAIGAAVTLLLVAGPFVLLAPGPFFEQVIRFQLIRPADGIQGGAERLREMVRPAWPFFTLAAIGLAAALRSRSSSERRDGRVFGVAWLSTLAAFLLSASYWPRYNVFLAPAEAHLAGLGAAWLWGLMPRSRVFRGAVVAILAAALMVPFGRSWQRARSGGDEVLVRIGERVRSLPAEECYIAMEPAWALAGDRLPSIREDRETLVDIYGVMLFAAVGSEHDRRTAAGALHTAAAQQRVREILADCENFSLGDRVRQLTPGTARWILDRWERLPADPSGADLWRLRR